VQFVGAQPDRFCRLTRVLCITIPSHSVTVISSGRCMCCRSFLMASPMARTGTLCTAACR
jgi:hypothetical protein